MPEKIPYSTVKTDSIPGIRDLPEYVKDYPAVYKEKSKSPPLRAVNFINTIWAPTGNYAVVEARAQDNKDRWLLLLDGATGRLSLLDRQRDEAWIRTKQPADSRFFNLGWVNDDTFWFQSETNGYSHLYTLNIKTKEKESAYAAEIMKYRTHSFPIIKNSFI